MASGSVSKPTTYSEATTSAAGLMSASDKTNLNRVAAIGNATTSAAGYMSATDKTNLDRVAAIGNATTSAAGYMSKDDKTKVNNLSSLFMTKTYSYSYTLASGSTLGIRASDFKDSSNNAVSTPSGYVPLAVREYNGGIGHCPVSRVRAYSTGSEQMMVIKNTSSNEQSNTATITIIYVRTGFGIS